MEAMINNSADGIAMLEAHEDAEVVRLRLGKALDFEYSEDSFAGLFQRRDPREAGPILDIERALSKLEKVCSRPFTSCAILNAQNLPFYLLYVLGCDPL